MQSVLIEINIAGKYAYESGVTPTVKERPYIRFAPENHETVVQTFGRNNPTFASSLRGKQSAGFAADGNMDTFWEATGEDYSPWWMLDTEKGLTLRTISVHFPKAAIYHYMIEVSDDNKEWKTVLDRRNGRVVEQRTDITFSVQEAPVTGRFIRISFVDKSPAAIAEVEVSGVVRE